MSIEINVLSEIFGDTSFTDREKKLTAEKLEKIKLKKGDMLLQANYLVHHQYYVSDGCLRTYFLDKSGKEHTLQFAIKDWWVSDFTAFFNTSEAMMNIACIQDATVYKMTRKGMEELYAEVPQIETFFRKKMEKAFAAFQKRILSNLSHSAKERYVSFIKSYPNIEQSVKNYHIASYLGITTESLSRIRKEITQ